MTTPNSPTLQFKLPSAEGSQTTLSELSVGQPGSQRGTIIIDIFIKLSNSSLTTGDHFYQFSTKIYFPASPEAPLAWFDCGGRLRAKHLCLLSSLSGSLASSWRPAADKYRPTGISVRYNISLSLSLSLWVLCQPSPPPPSPPHHQPAGQEIISNINKPGRDG